MNRIILHISDLHRDATNDTDQRAVLNPFLEDVARQRGNGISFDLVFFTGDIVRRAEAIDDYVLAAEDFSTIALAADVPETAVLFCPGNHDADQSFVKNHISQLSEFRRMAQTRDGLNNLMADTDFAGFVLSSFGNYRSFTDLFDKSLVVSANVFGELRLFPATEVGVVCLNTAALSGAGLSVVSDRNQLAVPEHALRDLLAKVPTSYSKLVIGHHPLDWLNDQSRADIETLLSQHGAHYFHGHMHEVNPKYIRTSLGESATFQASALYCGRENNGYGICS